jgi:hypothetical protein
MNERIKELVEEAGSDWDRTMPEGKTFLELFAELIVRECLDIASEIRGEPRTDTHFVIGYDLACKRMVDAFKEHFGIES